jgi:IS5 family transposase
MRKKHKKQLPLMEPAPVHPKAQEWAEISSILQQNDTIYERALQDLTTKDKNYNAGASGMTADQVVRAAIVKQVENFSYRDLAFHLADSRVFGNFCKIGFADKPFKKSTLQKNIKSLSAETWEDIHRVIIKDAEATGVEKGRKVRIDCTVVESNIHAPYDSDLLWDSVRVLDRLLCQARETLKGISFPYNNRTKRAKRRCLGVMNAKNSAGRKRQYKDLLKVTKTVISYAQSAIPELESFTSGDFIQPLYAIGIARELKHYLPLAVRVVDQTERRVLQGESVPASEKIVSIFEEHTDIIRKDRRDTYYGHKVCLTGGATNLILDCLILEGNPADSTLTDTMFDRQNKLYGRYPLKASLDGGFASQDNLKSAKGKGVKDVCFAKGKGLKEDEMCRSSYVYRTLRRFRAGIESGISWLKRSIGLDCCLWKGFDSFKSYVWASIVSANLLTLARAKLSEQ